YVGFARLRGAPDFRRALYGTERSRGIDQLPFLLDLTRPRNHPSEQNPCESRFFHFKINYFESIVILKSYGDIDPA
ncbi:hypothetical protein, partial [Burkholderia ubonensis]|uniref:hypothetical protein n=1 Tax=Burkholderia ubonensis TaxID=101571 RepID=UPI001C432C42